MAKKKSNTQLWIMLALIAVILAVILFLPSCVSEGNDEQATTIVKAEDPAPDFSFEWFDGGMASFSEVRSGKVALLTFWASWCPSCQQEMKRVQSDIIDRFAGQEFVFVAISRGESRADIATYREKNGYTFPMGLDPSQQAYHLYASKYVPRNFLVDRNGKVIVSSVGYSDRDFDQLIETIVKTLEQQ